MSYFILMGRRIPKQAITGFRFQNETDNIRPFLSIRIRGKEEITVIPDCHRFIVFLPKKSTIGSKNPIMGILEENRTFISSRPGCILCRLDEMESWAYLDDLLP